MAEVQSRTSAPRGRGSHRAGRGGFSSRGGRSASKQLNGEAVASNAVVPLEEQGELGQLKKQYKSQLSTLKELFPDWTDEDLVFALQETDGDLQSTIERISEGMSLNGMEWNGMEWQLPALGCSFGASN